MLVAQVNRDPMVTMSMERATGLHSWGGGSVVLAFAGGIYQLDVRGGHR